MRIVGIDPGLRLTGYGVVEFAAANSLRPRLVDAGVFRLSEKEPIAFRLMELERELDGLFDEQKPDICAIEQLYAHYAHPRTAILMGHARGVIMVVAAWREIRIEQYAANRIKQAVAGHGHAGKMSMQRAVQAVWNLKALPSPPDVADALAVALCCGRAVVEKRILDRAIRYSARPRRG